MIFSDESSDPKLGKVAITGGIASGKSTLLHLFMEMGAYGVDCDEIVHHLLTPATQVGQRIIDIMGKDILVQEGSCKVISRAKIAKRLLAHENLRAILETLIHPEVRRALEVRYEQALHKGRYAFFAAEVPLLYEMGMEGMFDYVVAMIAEEPLRRERYRARDGKIPHEERIEQFNYRSARQMREQDVANRADFLMENSVDLAVLESASRSLFQKLVVRFQR